MKKRFTDKLKKVFLNAFVFSIALTVNAQTITTDTIKGSPFCSGSTITVPFTTSGLFNPMNFFTAQLSDATGSFSSPIVIGTALSTPVNADIPVGITPGIGYRIRVTASNPATIGIPNTIDLIISSAGQTGALKAKWDTMCSGSFNILTVTGSSGNIQWQSASSPSGSFINIFGANGPTYIISPSESNPCYRAIIYNGTTCTGTTNTVCIAVLPSPVADFDYSVSGQQVNFNSAGSIGAIKYNWDFADNTKGTEINPVHNFNSAGDYRVCLLVSNGTNCSFTACKTVQVGSIVNTQLSTGAIYPNSVCQGANVPVRFVCTNTYNTGNIFTAQLSDAAGSFSNPEVIGTLNSASCGIITGIIPGSTPIGTGYRIRVIASAPYTVGMDNGKDIIINDSCFLSAGFVLPEYPVLKGDCVQFIDQSIGNPNVWSWVFEGGLPSYSIGKTPPSVCYNTAGTYCVTLFVENGTEQHTLKECFQIIDATGDMGKTASTVTFYPNPVRDRLFINSCYSLFAEIEIKNVVGQTLLAKKISSPKTDTDVSWLTQGIYFLSVKTPDGNLTVKKFVKP